MGIHALSDIHPVGESLHGLLQRRLVVIAVRLPELDVIGAEAPQRTVDRFGGVRAVEAGAIRRLRPSGRNRCHYPPERTTRTAT